MMQAIFQPGCLVGIVVVNSEGQHLGIAICVVLSSDEERLLVRDVYGGSQSQFINYEKAVRQKTIILSPI
jgi:hypothetical protein